MTTRGRALRLAALPFVLSIALAGCGLGSFQDTVDTSIGADGGRLVAADGGLVVEVPPGAVDDGTSLLVEPVGDEGAGAGYRVGPENLALQAPVRLTHSGPSPLPDEEDLGPAELPVDLLVTEGSDGTPLLLEEQEVRRGGNGAAATSGRVSEPGDVLVADGHLAASASPAHLVVPVGSGFSGEIAIRAVEGAPEWVLDLLSELAAAAEPAGSGAVVPAGEAIAAASGPVVHVAAEFVCELPGRGRFGIAGAGLRVLVGTVDCEQAEQFETLIGRLPEVQWQEREQLHEDIPPGDDDAVSSGDSDGGAVEIGTGAASATIGELPVVDAAVGEVFVVKVPVQVESGGPAGDYHYAEATALVRGGLQSVSINDIYSYDRAPTLTIVLRCTSVGRHTYGARLVSEHRLRHNDEKGYPEYVGPGFQAERFDGTAACRPTQPSDHSYVAVHHGGSASDYRVIPDRFVAPVGEYVSVQGSVRRSIPIGTAQSVRYDPGIDPGEVLSMSSQLAEFGGLFGWSHRAPEFEHTSDSWLVRCNSVGAQRYYADISIEPYDADWIGEYGVTSGNISDRQRAYGTATCRAASTSTDEVALLDGFGVPREAFVAGGVLLEGGPSLSAPPAVSGMVGQVVAVTGQVTVPEGAGTERWLVLVEPRHGPGEVLLETDTGAVPLLVSGAAAVPFELAVGCGREGVQLVGVRVTVHAEQPDGSFAEPVTETVYPSLVRCAEDAAGAVPVGFGLAGAAGVDDADASLPATLEGPCDGRAIIDGGVTVDPSASGGVYTVPRQGSASYHGAIEAVAGEPRVHNGQVAVSLPAGLSVPIGSWEGETDEVSRSGSWSWDLAGWVPGGAVVPVSGIHVDTAGVCTATVMVRFDGGFTDSPVGPAAAALALLSLGGLVWAGLPKP